MKWPLWPGYVLLCCCKTCFFSNDFLTYRFSRKLDFSWANIYIFLKGREEFKKKEMNEDGSLETVYLGVDEDSSNADQERTDGKADIS